MSDPVEVAQANLRAAVVVLLHELSWQEDGQRHALTLHAEQAADGRVDGDIAITNKVTRDQWGASL